MIRHVTNPLRQRRDLHLRAPDVVRVRRERLPRRRERLAIALRRGVLLGGEVLADEVRLDVAAAAGGTGI
jgi:hypothetical protein